LSLLLCRHPTGEEDHLRFVVAVRLDASGKLETADSRHLNIRQDYHRPPRQNKLLRRLAVRSFQHVEAVQLQGRPNHLPDVRIIICDYDGERIVYQGKTCTQ